VSQDVQTLHGESAIRQKIAEELRSPSVEMMVDVVGVVIPLSSPIVERYNHHEATVRCQNPAKFTEFVEGSCAMFKCMVCDRYIDALALHAPKGWSGLNPLVDCLSPRNLTRFHTQPITTSNCKQEIAAATTKVKDGIGLSNEPPKQASLDYPHVLREGQLPAGISDATVALIVIRESGVLHRPILIGTQASDQQT
jgi:hypothetical protein